MSYTALYRKFRPATFDEVKGQEHIVTTLRNQIRYDRIGHAYVFCGTRGTGKTSVAKIFARAVNCENPVNGSPCGVCEMCRSIAEGTSTNVIEIDAASNNSVDNVREIVEEVTYRPTKGRYKVYIIDEVHMLSTGAFNALLKTLEEPPSYVIFILATTEAAKLPVTILSRCQRYDFHRLDTATIARRISELLEAEGVTAEERGVRYIARMADGSMRDGLSLLDQCIAGSPDERLTYDGILNILGTVDTENFDRLLEAIRQQDVSAAIRTVADIAESGKEMAQFTADFVWYLRDMLLAKNAGEVGEIPDLSTENLDNLRKMADRFEEDTLMYYIRVFSELSGTIRNTASRRIAVEMAVISLAKPALREDAAALTERVRLLEKKLEDGDFAPPARPAEPARQQPEEKQAEREEPRKPAPEDLMKIARDWRTITAKIKLPVVRTYLEQCEPSYDGRNGSEDLFLRTDNLQARTYLEREESLAAVRDTIAQVSGCRVNIHVLEKTNAKAEGLSRLPLMEKIRAAVDMPVEIEE